MAQPAKFFQSVIYGNPDYYPPMIRGAVILDEAGFSQEILSVDWVSRHLPDITVQYASATKVVRFQLNGHKTWRRYLNFVGHVLAKGRPDAAFFVGYDMYGLLAAQLLARRYKRPLVYHCHDFVEKSRKLSVSNRIIKLMEQRISVAADLVIVPDRERAEFMRSELGLHRQPLVAANSALEQPPSSGTGNSLREILQARGKSFEHIIFRQGHIGESHGIEETIRSIPHWTKQNAGFVIIGLGSEDYKQQLRTLAEQLGVSNQFEILPPVNSYSELSTYTVGASIGHALYEPSHVNHRFITAASNKTMEYMAARLPILLGDTPSNRAIIAKYENGIVVDVANPMQIAQGINEILNDPARLAHMADGSNRAFHEEYNYTLQYSPVIERFQEWVDQS